MKYEKNKYQIIPIRSTMPEKYQKELDEFILFAIMTRMKEAKQDVGTNLESLTTYLLDNDLLSKEDFEDNDENQMGVENQQGQHKAVPVYLLGRSNTSNSGGDSSDDSSDEPQYEDKDIRVEIETDY